MPYNNPIPTVPSAYQEQEFAFLLRFVQGAVLYESHPDRDTLYALWLAFCAHHSVEKGSKEYNQYLETIWNAAQEDFEGDTGYWEDFEEFSEAMGDRL